MKAIKRICLIIILMTATLYSYSQKYQVRIAFIGNSITIGTGLPNPEEDCYPSQFAAMLEDIYGDTCLVRNFAVSGRTMLKQGDYPIWDENSFTDAWNFAPDICFIMLGTNDSKPQNWDVYGDQFIDDYMSMIDTFKVRNALVKFIVCYPPPAYEIVYDIRDSVILHGVLPAVDSVINNTDAELLDFYYPLLDSVYLFPDKIHPNVKGAGVMAEMVFDKFIETNIIHEVDTGYTYITSLKTSDKLISVKDSATLSWTTVNADSVYFDGDKVELNGSLKVSPGVTTEYTLVAIGEKSTDSMKLEQQVYQPELDLIRIFPKAPKIYEGDSVVLTLRYYDQMGEIITDSTFDVTWSVVQGDGYLHNENDTGAVFIAVSAGDNYVRAEAGEINYQITVSVKAQVSAVIEHVNTQEIIAYPNPFEDIIFLNIVTEKSEPVIIRLFDLKGTLHKQEYLYITSAGKHIVSLNTIELGHGTYLYEIEQESRRVTGKIDKK